MVETVATISAKAHWARRIVFVSGNFNVVHPGHLRLLNFAAECGDFLVVGVNEDTRRWTLVPENLRLEAVQAISVVNYAFIMHGPPEQLIAMLKPAIVVKGKEYEVLENPERAVVESYGGKLLFGSGDVKFSSLDLLQRELLETNFSTIRKPLDYPERHDFAVKDLTGIVKKFTDLNVVVMGDLIVDEYINCEPLGMSQEDPTIVVTPIREDRFVGGAAIVAAHARGMGANVQYVCITGDDPVAEFALKRLQQYGVRCEAIVDESRPTTLKQRFRALGKTLLRVSHLRQHDISQELADVVLAKVKRMVKDADLVIFSDFNYGCLPQPLVERLVEHCDRERIMMVADSQSSSQVSDVSRFKGMRLLTPTEREARLAIRDFNSGLVVLADKLREKAKAAELIITLGQEGILVNVPSRNGDMVIDKLPAFNTSPKDTSGAGDSLLTCTALSLAVGTDIWRSAYLGSIAAACQVSRVGNSPVSAKELVTEISF
jgi:rfaE bifunctional protein kinase chain/domain